MILDLLACPLRHFFRGFNRRLGHIHDHRDPSRTTYTVAHLIWLEMMLFLCGSWSRYAMVAPSKRLGFRDALRDLADTEEKACAHPDTVCWFLEKLDPRELIGVQAWMVRRLLRMRCLEHLRFGREWLVAVDGVWLRTYKEKHCDRCLHQKLPNGDMLWMHAVLEAKLILPNGMAISLASVSIENTGGPFDKQDCELVAFSRLAGLLKTLFPRLPICIVSDSLYGCERAIDICERMRWSYIITFKEGRTPALWKRALDKANQGKRKHLDVGAGQTQTLKWTTNLSHEGHTTHALFCDEVWPDGSIHPWSWITDHRPDEHNVHILANQGGRQRWKIENQGFNEQKNGEYGLKHDYGSKGNAWYNTYLVVQIVHLMVQLIRFSDLTTKLSNGKYSSFTSVFPRMAELAHRIRESVQRDRVSPRFSPGADLDIVVHINSS